MTAHITGPERLDVPAALAGFHPSRPGLAGMRAHANAAHRRTICG